MMRQLGKNQRLLLREATRRYLRFGEGRALVEAWTGLGTASFYAPAVRGGYMERLFEPNPGYVCWWKLTPLGAKIVQGWIDAGLTFEQIEREDWGITAQAEAEIILIG